MCPRQLTMYGYTHNNIRNYITTSLYHQSRSLPRFHSKRDAIPPSMSTKNAGSQFLADAAHFCYSYLLKQRLGSSSFYR